MMSPFKVIFLFFVMLVFLCHQGIAQVKASKQGPELVTELLKNDGVFNSPAFTFTNKYDSISAFAYQKGLFFNGLNYHGKATKVFCWYGVPENLKSGAKVPAVVLVHGGGGTAFQDWVKKWNDEGYVAIAIGLEGQAPGKSNKGVPTDMKWPTFAEAGPYRTGFFLDIEKEKTQDVWFYHAVADAILANSLLRTFPEVDATNIGITGISWGGILTNVITGIDHRFRFAVPVYGCGYLEETPNYSNQLKLLTEKGRALYLQTWEPSLYIPLQKQPTLFVNGTNDFHFTLNSFNKSYLASLTEKYLHVGYKMKHSHIHGWEPTEIIAFANYITKGRQQPTQIISKGAQGKKVNFSYTGEIAEATLYYTTDPADWGSTNYEWIPMAANISNSGHLITAELPQEAVYYFVNTKTKEGEEYSSPMITLLKK